MKKMRKIFAVLLTLAMVLAMSMTAFASEVGTKTNDTASLTVSGLVPGEATEVSVYKVVGWNAAGSEWERGTGVAEADVNFSTDPVGIKWEKFAAKRNSLAQVATTSVTDGTVTFHGLEIGAYYVYAQSGKTTYNPMGEAVYTYDTTTGLMKPADKTITAKGEKYTLTKAFKDGNTTTYQVVERGQEVPFTITAVFPSYDKDATDRAFQITDEPKGMKVTEVTVKVGNETLVFGRDYTLVGVKGTADGDAITATADENQKVSVTAAEDQKVRVRFTKDYIGANNAHAGQTVTVEVKAQITDADTFANKATSDKGNDTPNVEGKLGSIAINKYDEKFKETPAESKLLAGAEFSIAPVTVNENKEEVKGSKIQFVFVEKDSNGVSVYKKATDEELADDKFTKVTNIVAEDGKVIAKGLDDGTYAIVEEKAPKGYSVVPVNNATIENGTNPTVTVDVSDTQLHELPHTGGIGTTIFTIAGCLIMVTAAGLFFASRKKANK